MGYVYLAIAVVSEVIATSALKASEEFSRPLPSVIVVVGYAVAFYFLTLVLRSIPIGVAYAIWSGLGIALICVIGLCRLWSEAGYGRGDRPVADCQWCAGDSYVFQDHGSLSRGFMGDSMRFPGWVTMSLPEFIDLRRITFAPVYEKMALLTCKNLRLAWQNRYEIGP